MYGLQTVPLSFLVYEEKVSVFMFLFFVGTYCSGVGGLMTVLTDKKFMFLAMFDITDRSNSFFYVPRLNFDILCHLFVHALQVQYVYAQYYVLSYSKS